MEIATNKTTLKEDLHLHTHFSDGQNSPREMIDGAHKLGLNRIAITDHNPVPFDASFAMKLEDLPRYRDEIQALKESSPLQLLMGLEVDFFGGDRDWTDQMVAFGWEICVGSVHRIYHKKSGLYFPLGMRGDFEYALEVFGSIQEVCAQYFAEIQETARMECFTFLGHIDRMRRADPTGLYIRDDFTWYQDLLHETLDVIAAHNQVIEINTSGIDHRQKLQYPRDWVLQQALKRGIPLVINSDAHRVDQIGRYFDQFSNYFKE